jgi:NifU-like protein involved in Fe-S cluster formation
MYSAKVLDHLENPRNVGAMEAPSIKGEATNPVCGDLLHLYLKVEDNKIIAASFQANGCPPSLAAGSVLTEMVTGLMIDEALILKPLDVTKALETLPRNKEHCAILAIDALKSALVFSHP